MRESNIYILGIGWLGLPLLESLREEGLNVSGSVSSVLKYNELLNSIDSIDVYKIGDDFPLKMADASIVIVTLPPSAFDNCDVHKWCLLLKKEIQNDAYVIYTSSIGVYGNISGEITEETTPNSSSEKAMKVLDLERAFLKTFSDCLRIVRLGGLVGKDRHPGLFFKQGKLTCGENEVVNLITKEDAVGVLKCLIEGGFEIDEKVINAVAPMHEVKEVYYNEARADIGKEKLQVERTKDQGKVVLSNVINNYLNYNWKHPSAKFWE